MERFTWKPRGTPLAQSLPPASSRISQRPPPQQPRRSQIYARSYAQSYARAHARAHVRARAHVASHARVPLCSTVFYCINRSVLTRKLAGIKEADGDIEGACACMLDVYVETFGALSKREKIDFILEQIR